MRKSIRLGTMNIVQARREKLSNCSDATTCILGGLLTWDVAQAACSSRLWPYTFRTLPLGVLRSLKEGLIHGDRAAFQRAGAIAVGLALTTAGYIAGPLSKPSISLSHDPEKVLPASSADFAFFKRDG
jgi:hypothetical protein